MDHILRANLDSKVEQTETAGPTVELAYASKKPYPDLSKGYDDIDPLLSFPSTSSAFGNQQTFFIPAGYYVPLIRLKMNYKRTLSSAGESKSKIAIDMIQNLQVQQNGQTIFETTSEGLYALYNQFDPAIRAFAFRYSTQLVEDTEANYIATTSPATVECCSYLPIHTSWFSGVYQTAINTSKIENITIVIRYNSRTTSGSVNDFISFSSKMRVHRYKPADPLYGELVTKDWSGSLKMPSYNVMVETWPITQAVTAAGPTAMNILNFQSNCFYNVLKTYVMIKQSGMTTPLSGVEVNHVWGRPLQQITKLSVDVGGSPWIVDMKKSQFDYEIALSGRSTGCFERIETITSNGAAAVLRNITVSESIIEPICVTYGALSAEYNTGLAFFKQLSKPTFKVSWNYTPYQTLQPSTDYTLYLVHVFENIVGADMNNLKIVMNN